LSPEWVGYRSELFAGAGLGKGEALAKALWIAVPAIAASGAVLILWARRGRGKTL